MKVTIKVDCFNVEDDFKPGQCWNGCPLYIHKRNSIYDYNRCAVKGDEDNCPIKIDE